jgi:hypothetical protein
VEFLDMGRRCRSSGRQQRARSCFAPTAGGSCSSLAPLGRSHGAALLLLLLLLLPLPSGAGRHISFTASQRGGGGGGGSSCSSCNSRKCPKIEDTGGLGVPEFSPQEQENGLFPAVYRRRRKLLCLCIVLDTYIYPPRRVPRSYTGMCTIMPHSAAAKTRNKDCGFQGGRRAKDTASHHLSPPLFPSE